MTATAHQKIHLLEPADRLFPLSKALEVVGVSRSKVYLLLKAGDFPKPVKIGRSNYFSSLELQAWIGTQLVARNPGAVATETSLGRRSGNAGCKRCQ